MSFAAAAVVIWLSFTTIIGVFPIFLRLIPSSSMVGPGMVSVP